MPVYERGQRFTPEKGAGNSYTWVIGRDTESIAIDVGSTIHVDLATEAGFCDKGSKFPIVRDSDHVVFTYRKGWLIPGDFTSTTPEALLGLERNTPEYFEAFRGMRRVSTQMLADLIGEPVTAEFPDGPSEKFFPQESANL